jgi:hypothetical protein
MYIDINTLFTFEVSKSDDQSILAAIVLSRTKKTGHQNHALTQWKMLHCKTVVNIITYYYDV